MDRDARLPAPDGVELRRQDGAARRSRRGFDTRRGPAADGADPGLVGHRGVGVQDAQLGRARRRPRPGGVLWSRRGSRAGRGGKHRRRAGRRRGFEPGKRRQQRGGTQQTLPGGRRGGHSRGRRLFAADPRGASRRGHREGDLHPPGPPRRRRRRVTRGRGGGGAPRARCARAQALGQRGRRSRGRRRQREDTAPGGCGGVVRFSPGGARFVSGLVSGSGGAMPLRPARLAPPETRGRLGDGRHRGARRGGAQTGAKGSARRVPRRVESGGASERTNQGRVRNRRGPIAGEDRGGARQRGDARLRAAPGRRTASAGPAGHRRGRRRRSKVHTVPGFSQGEKGTQASRRERHRRTREFARGGGSADARGRRGAVFLPRRAVGGDGGWRGIARGGARAVERDGRRVGDLEKRVG